MTRLLLDTDFFCKLGAFGLLARFLELIGADRVERLPTLPYMLRRGALRQRFGPEIVSRLLPLAESLPAVEAPAENAWLEQLVRMPDVDPGEAWLIAVAAERGDQVGTGDMRALRAVKDLPGLADTMRNRIVTLEAALLLLSAHLSSRVMREHIEPIRHLDGRAASCFSPGNDDPIAGLMSWHNGDSAELAPLVLWRPFP